MLQQGIITYVIATGVDLTEQVSAEAAQRDLEEQLYRAQKLESIGRLAGGVAHDFNNQLTAMMGYARLALRQLPEGQAGHRELKIILESTQRASTLTRQLLTFARQQDATPTHVDLNKLITQIDTMLQQVCGEQVTLIYQLKPNLGTVLADPNQLEQVLVNFIVNSVDAMPSGGELTVTTRNINLTSNNSTYLDLLPGSYVRLMVHDNGMGIAEDIQNKIFDPFFTTKPVGQGTGLGLATCFGIIAQHKGYITVDSQLGHGATFIVDLPRQTLSDFSIQHHLTSLTEPPLGEGRILLVEDEQHVRHHFADMLLKLGYQVTSATNGLEALTLYQESAEPYQLILTDVVMPVMGGYELITQLQQLSPTLPPIVYMSGYMGKFSLPQPDILAPEIPHLAKPFTFENLAQTVQLAIVNTRK